MAVDQPLHKVSKEAGLTATEKKKAKMSPIWSRAYISRTRSHAFTEVPLIAQYKEVRLYNYGGENLTEAERKQVFSGSFQRLLTFKRNGVTEQFILTYIPSITYLKTNKFDASSNHINDFSDDFSGYVEYRRLNGKRAFVLQFKNGKAIHRFWLNRTEIGARNNPGAKNKVMTGGNNCTTTYEAIYFSACGPVGDPPEEHCSEPQFSHWAERTVCMDVPDPEDPNNEDECMDPANFYAYGCGDPYYDPDEEPAAPEIINDVDDPCTKAQLQAVLENDLRFNVNQSLNDIFNNNDQVNLYFSDDTLSSNTAGDTGLRYDFSVDGVRTIGIDIRLNSAIMPGASKEFITSTILHEALHAYFRRMEREGDLDHTMMAELYIDWFMDMLDNQFPNIDPIDNEALAWGGLQNTAAWAGLSSMEKSLYQVINTNHKNATNGTPCQ